ncbi:MAG TPA: 2-amino-4-hydroxy-6-hydroxymethyldihydropteridine diphosphokinase [Novosphingobium sp.]|nr:2-amino-4-hydroxy-6-hydroxymethyldihydropteridine diphosphokinase [Novosphingobium sp.]
MHTQRYLVALGSNMRHHRHGRPRQILQAALEALADERIIVSHSAPILFTAPLGPSRRRYANGAAVVSSALEPEAMLARLQAVERRFGRRRTGQRWTARVLDLDIVLWDGGFWSSPALTIPHPQFRHRDFVLHPACAIAPCWRDPLTGLTLRQLRARLTRPRPLPR